jgi:hypothetical protein
MTVCSKIVKNEYGAKRRLVVGGRNSGISSSSVLARRMMAKVKAPRDYTNKQTGDACEMLVAGEVILAGVPALKMPDNWPCYDVIGQPKGGGAPQRIP